MRHSPSSYSQVPADSLLEICGNFICKIILSFNSVGHVPHTANTNLIVLIGSGLKTTTTNGEALSECYGGR